MKRWTLPLLLLSLTGALATPQTAKLEHLQATITGTLTPSAHPTRVGPLHPSIRRAADDGLLGPVHRVTQRGVSYLDGKPYSTSTSIDTYDRQGRITSSVSLDQNGEPDGTKTWTYDGLRLSEFKADDPFGTRTVFTYSKDGHLLSETTYAPGQTVPRFVDRYTAFPNGYVMTRYRESNELISTITVLQDARGRELRREIVSDGEVLQVEINEYLPDGRHRNLLVDDDYVQEVVTQHGRRVSTVFHDRTDATQDRTWQYTPSQPDARGNPQQILTRLHSTRYGAPHVEDNYQTVQAIEYYAP